VSEEQLEDNARVADTAPGRSLRVAIVVAVVFVFGVLVGWKALAGSQAAGPPAAESGVAASTATSVRNDALADYEAALQSGRPIFVLFHSLTCQPCIEISEVADAVVPDYQGQLTFVNAITDDASAQELAGRFSFQYIPTSFFLTPDGAVADSHTGTMGEAEMRARLDVLLDTR